MAQKEARSEQAQSPSPRLDFAGFTALGKKQMEEFASAQTELFDQLQDANREWLDRIQAAANLASEFTQRLASARSVPDAMTAFYDWVSRWSQMVTVDQKQLLAAYEKLWETGVRLLSNGWQYKGAGIGT